MKFVRDMLLIQRICLLLFIVLYLWLAILLLRWCGPYCVR